VPGPDYDQFAPTVGGHCQGTQHQTIEGVERVVFLGDSVTVGTPPTQRDDYYRSRLADQLAAHFSLEAPSVFWKASDPFSGTAGLTHSGDFSSCAAWGARVDDLMVDNDQVLECFPEDQRGDKTLVIMTIGGNDLANITKQGPEGVPLDEIWAQTEQWIQDLRDAMAWMTDPQNVPGGVYIVFANLFEFTDGTGDVTSCSAASLAGFDAPWDNPEDLEAMVVWATEQYMDIAVETGTDMIFMLEHFCGHGFYHDDPENRCYRGPQTERWFDLSCTHPNPAGHQAISEMFMSVVEGG
jgi:lysophospholipase L1-like esterase